MRQPARGEHGLAGDRLQPTQAQHADHGQILAEPGKIEWSFAAGQQQTTTVPALAQPLDKLAVWCVASLVDASLPRLEDSFQVVENEQAARAAQILQQKVQLLAQVCRQLGQAIARQHLQRGAQDLVQRRRIEQ